MMTNYNDNLYFDQYERLLIDLSDAIWAQDKDRANEVRRLMEGPERELTDEMMERLDGLAADLYMLSGKELFERTDPAEAVPARLGVELRQVWDNKDWERVLVTLRKRMPFLSEEHRAYLRAVAYEGLGQVRSAFRFMDYASQLNPADPVYRFYVLDYLVKLGESDEAVGRARQYITDTESAPAVLIEAAVTLVQTSRGQPNTVFQSRAAEAIPVLTQVLNNAVGLDGTPREVIALAYVTMGFCLQGLGDMDTADVAYRLALKVDPSNDVAQNGLRAVLEDRAHVKSLSFRDTTVPTAASDIKMSNTSFTMVKANQIWALAI